MTFRAPPPNSSSCCSSSVAAAEAVAGGADVDAEVVRRDVGDRQRGGPKVVAQLLLRLHVSATGIGGQATPTGRARPDADKIVSPAPHEGDRGRPLGRAGERARRAAFGRENRLHDGGKYRRVCGKREARVGEHEMAGRFIRREKRKGVGSR